MTIRATTGAPAAMRENRDDDGDGPTARHDAGPEPWREAEHVGQPDARTVAAARARLLTHRLDPEHAGCAACGAPSPCVVANEAAAVVVAAGAWNTLPFHGPALVGASRHRDTGPGEGHGGALTRVLADLARRVHRGNAL